jgi:hypothetical protein
VGTTDVGMLEAILVAPVTDIFGLIACTSTMLVFGMKPAMYFDRRLWELVARVRHRLHYPEGLTLVTATPV